MRITENQVSEACKIAQKVYDNEVKKVDGVNELVNIHGLNRATANDFIYDFKCLLLGKVFHRAMSAGAMYHFMSRINSEYGMDSLKQAVISLKAHIKYYEGHFKVNMHKLRGVADEFEQLTLNSKTYSVIQQEFRRSVKESLKDNQLNRLKRLTRANKTPKKIKVTSTVFIRNPDVVAETLVRADGTCESCLTEAPFLRVKDRTPYLEVHHKLQLSKGGEDSVDNTIALCPNCHRKEHYGMKVG
jgi:5-methylcytosine-specific restriction protein A